MTIKWTGFSGSPVALTSSDIVVGLRGGTTNERFLASSMLLVADNLSTVSDKTISFNNLSPLTTKGDIIYFDGTNNVRIPVGTANQILSVNGSNVPTWISTTGFGLTTATSTTASATPGTIRALIGSMTGSALTISSGNLVGTRGEVHVVSASGGFFYGTQGKMFSTGTLSGSSWSAGVFGQFDISAATIDGGQTAVIWGDYGATSGTITDGSGMRGIAMTNTTAAVLNAQDYRYGNATYLFELAGAGGTLNYYEAAGTSAGSAGDPAQCAAQQVIKIEINGVAAYIPVFTQNT